MLKKIHNLKQKSGSWLLIIRLPSRFYELILRKLNTFYCSLILGKVGSNVIIERGVRFENPKNVHIGDNVYIGRNSMFGSEFLDGMLYVHNNVQISSNCKVDHTGGVTIMENALLSANVVIFSHSHGYNPRSLPIKKQIVIGANCWIGYNAVILENTKQIADNVIIAACSVVNKPCDNKQSIYGGMPAKFIKNY